MKKQGYFKGNSDHILFVKKNKENIAILLVYVNDMMITYDDFEEIGKMKMLAAEFELKDVGKLRYFLGIEMARSPTRLTLIK